MYKSITHIHLSSLHFGTETDGQPYIHLNNLYPDHPKFHQMWKGLISAYNKDIKIVVMIGGAGGGYASLFQNYTTHYQQLKMFLRNHEIITGVDLDIEEPVALDSVKKLIGDLSADFPHFTISLAPVQSSLQQDTPGMGGFVYKDLFNSEEGKLISYFNVQFYSDFSKQAYDEIIQNGYPSNMIVMGSESGTGSASTVQDVVDADPHMGGVFSWEYFNTPKSWAPLMRSIVPRTKTPRIHDQSPFQGFLLWCCSVL